jgi:cyclic-di-AMP phosphodiesterase PgpH
VNSILGSGDRALPNFLKLFNVFRVSIVFLSFLCIATLIFSYDYQNRSTFSIGDVASRDLHAKRSVMPYFNKVKTEQLRNEAASDVEIRLTQNHTIAEETKDHIYYIYRQILDERNNRLKKDSEKIEEISSLLGLSEENTTIATYLLTTESTTLKYIFDAAAEINLELLEAGVRKENIAKKYETIELIALSYNKDGREETVQAIIYIAQKELRPNLTVDEETTNLEREKAKARIAPVQENIRINELLVEKGEILTQEDIERLKAAGYFDSTTQWMMWVHALVYPFILFFFLFLYLFLSNKQEWITHLKKFNLLFASIIFVVFISRFFIPLDLSLVPLFMFSIIMTVFFNKPFGYFITTVLTVLFLPFFGMDIVYTSVYLLSALFTIQLFSVFRTYADYILKCFFAGFLFALLGFVIFSIFPGYSLQYVLYHPIFLMFINGFVSGLFTLGIILALERLFAFITPLRLIELGDSNSPLLRYLFEVAPGSYQHSIMVANIASHAAKKIGADDMLVRVGAYYHDIGKTVFPFYFTENSSGKNILDDLSPHESVDIIKGHILNGVQLAEKNRIPPGIRRFILTHHGTTRISFLFQAAQALDPTLQDDKGFRYPGPKPVSKEETILLFADSIEAAVRSMSDKDTEKIQGVVDDIVNMKIQDGQLEESQLTFADLREAKESFVFTLDSLYHSRITYPVSKIEDKKIFRKNPYHKRGSL